MPAAQKSVIPGNGAPLRPGHLLKRHRLLVTDDVGRRSATLAGMPEYREATRPTTPLLAAASDRWVRRERGRSCPESMTERERHMTFDEYWKSASKDLFRSLERALKEAAHEAWEAAKQADEQLPADPIPYQKIIDLYYEVLPFGSACRKLTAKRKASIRARWKSGDLPDLDTWREYFERAAKSKFIRGEVPPGIGHQQFLVSLDFLLREDSYAKALENTGAFKW